MHQIHIAVLVGSLRRESFNLKLAQPEAFVQAKDDLFDANGDIGTASNAFFQAWMDQHVAWVKKHAGSTALIATP